MDAQVGRHARLKELKTEMRVVFRYTFGGKKHKIETDRPEFSRLADRPGIFEITSVSHRKTAHVSFVMLDSPARLRNLD